MACMHGMALINFTGTCGGVNGLRCAWDLARPGSAWLGSGFGLVCMT
jgi:hypothetical protein